MAKQFTEVFRGPMPSAKRVREGFDEFEVVVPCRVCGKPVRIEYTEEYDFGYTPGRCCGLQYGCGWQVELVVHKVD